VRALAPALALYTDEVLFADAWRREQLSLRDRSIVTVTTLITNGRAAQLRGHTNRAFGHSVKPAEIAEIITHLAFYAGWPAAMSAVPEVKAVFDERGIEPALLAEVPTEPLPVDAASEARRAASVHDLAGTVAPPLAPYADTVLFGDLWRRPALAPRDRSPVTMVSLIANGQAEQLAFHVNHVMEAGLSEAEVSEVRTHRLLCRLAARGVSHGRGQDNAGGTGAGSHDEPAQPDDPAPCRGGGRHQHEMAGASDKQAIPPGRHERNRVRRLSRAVVHLRRQRSMRWRNRAYCHSKSERSDP
jgi:4-carboxymuconolactone decarboxylase